MNKLFLVFCYSALLLVSCGDSRLDGNFDNINSLPGSNGSSPPTPSANPPVLSGAINISASDGSATSFPTSIWPAAVAGTDAIDLYEISIAQDEGSGICDENDFLGSLTLAWTKVPAATDFSGAGYKINNLDLDGNGNTINVNWSGNTNYCLAVRAKDINGLSSAEVYSSTVAVFKYISCKEKFDYEVSPTNGVYSIDVDGNGVKAAFDVYCDMTTNGGGWTLLLNQNPISGNLFSSTANALNQNETDPINTLYSIIDKTQDFLRAGSYEFYQTWPGTSCSSTPHHWTQTSVPHLNAGVTGYTSISTPTNQGSGGFNGLCQSSSPGNSLLASNCGTGTWWYAVGALGLFGGGTPGCSGPVDHVQLWVR